MKALWTIAALAAAGGLFAFDSAKWMAARADAADVDRLRGAYAKLVPSIPQPAENVAFPIEAYPDGTIKSRLRAGRAYMFLDSNFIWGADVVVEQYKQDGKTVMGRMTAENCLVDRKTKTGWAPGAAKITWDGTSVAGRGVHFDLGREYVTVFEDTHIVSRNVGGKGVSDVLGGGAGAKTKKAKAERKPGAAAAKKPATVTAARTDYDHKEGVVLFDRDVFLDDSEYQMSTDRLFVFLEGTNELRRLVALGNVAITNGAKSARCARATYARKIGRVDMYGDDGARARLEDRSGKQAAVQGDRITFWVDTEQVEVQGAEVSIPAFGANGKKGLGL